MKYLLAIIFLAGSVYFGYTAYNSVKEKLDFVRISEERTDDVVEKLELIRDAQLVYRENHGKYASSFDSLMISIKTENINVFKKIGDPNDTTVVSRIDTISVPIIDSLFKGDASKVAALTTVPHSESIKFELEAGSITKNELELPAFEVRTKYKNFFGGLNKRYYWQEANEYIKVGDITDGSTAGNWK